VAVGAQFGVVKVLGEGGEEVEVTTFRTDGPYIDGRHPESISPGNEQEDASRRDFTINGLFLDPGDGSVRDHVGGLPDLERRVVRCIGDPDQRFDEDKLRILRAVRISSQLDFAIDPDTEEALRRRATEVLQVSKERVGEELIKMFRSAHADLAVRRLHETGLLTIIVPELQGHVAGKDGGIEKTVAALARLGKSPSHEVGLAALLRYCSPPGVDDPEVEQRAGAARDICHRLRYSRRVQSVVSSLLLILSQIEHARSLTRAATRRLIAEPLLDAALDLHRSADPTGNDPDRLHLEGQLQAVGDHRSLPPPLLTGDDLVGLGMTPGKELGLLIEEIRDLQLEGSLIGREDALDLARRRIRSGRSGP
jgi:poly(A) polymerase